METKLCSRCGNRQPVVDFKNNMATCKRCVEQKSIAYKNKNISYEEAMSKIDSNEMRKCNVCGEDKPLSDYYPKNPFR